MLQSRMDKLKMFVFLNQNWSCASIGGDGEKKTTYKGKDQLLLKNVGL